MIDGIRALGPLRQLGYVVQDVDRAIRNWAVDGVGPWYLLPHIETTNFVFRGEPSSVDMSIGISYLGGMQIELIQQHCDQPTLYQEFLERSGEGLQHLGYFPEDEDAALRAVTRGGWTVAQQGYLGSGWFRYFDNEHHPGTTMEISTINDRRREFYARIENECLTWDGNGDPIRSR